MLKTPLHKRSTALYGTQASLAVLAYSGEDEEEEEKKEKKPAPVTVKPILSSQPGVETNIRLPGMHLRTTHRVLSRADISISRGRGNDPDSIVTTVSTVHFGTQHTARLAVAIGAPSPPPPLPPAPHPNYNGIDIDTSRGQTLYH